MRKLESRLNAFCYSLILVLIISYGEIASASCEPRAVVYAYVSEDYSRAAKLNNECLESYKAGGSPTTTTQWMDESLHAYHLATGSQIAAEMGQFQAARDMLDQVKAYFDANNSFLIASSEILNLTEGFYLEMIGNTYEAEQFYLRNRDQNALARLAVLAMNRHDYAAAGKWAEQSLQLDPLNLTSRIVLAAITYPNPLDGSTAKELSAVIDNGSASLKNQFMPAYYAEVWWAASWLRETGNIGILPQLD